SGLIIYLNKIFEDFPKDKTFEVSVLHPRDLPKSDIVKIDTEGAETPILSSMNLSEVELILLEYHFREDREAIKKLLQNEFILELEDKSEYEESWSTDYRKELAGNQFGRLFFASKTIRK